MTHCPDCLGRGAIGNDRCKTCGGTGKMDDKKGEVTNNISINFDSEGIKLAIDNGFQQLFSLLAQQHKEIKMALDAGTQALITAIDTATDKIAARIQKLIDQIAAGGLSPADVAAALQPEVDKLNALGQDPANPVPPSAA